ncbi:MAG: valine--tRNA ligase [Nitrososphaerales archaeon]
MELKPKIEEKRWDHALEKEVAESWVAKRVYTFNPNSGKEIFVIDTPPPYPSGRPWHIGAASHYAQIDMIARTARMMGYETYFPIGIDRNGLPVEIYTERKYKVKMHDLPREKFIELCRHALDDLEAEMLEVMKSMGMSGDFEHYYRTDSIEYRRLTQETFIELWKRGLIYMATRPNNYCVDCKTTIADAEVVYEERPTKLLYIKFKVKESGEDLIIATTRPELLCSCGLVVVHPLDERYKKLWWKHAIVPIFGREVEIRPHPSVKPEFGTGVVMVCSYGDYTDVLIFRELGLKEIIAIDESGKMTSSAGAYAGLTVSEARSKITEDLSSRGLLVREELIMHRTPICERSKTPIEIIPMMEFYLKQLEYVPELKKIAEQLIFHPEEHRQLYLNWIASLNIDWPISRRRVYATEIPVWYCKVCGEPHVPEVGNYYRPWCDKSPFDSCKRCGGKEFIGDTRTFDTWMDSSISPLFISGYRYNNELFKKAYPATLRPQGKDIIRTWLHYTVLRCYQLTGKAPFKHAWIMGYGVDEKGERMSKSKGNVLDPIPILKKYGADSFRMWSASEASLGSDFRCSEAKIASMQKYMTKLWNLFRFISSFPVVEECELKPTDMWILAELSNLVDACMEGYRDFNFFIPANRLREFVWNIFASHYVEMVKPRAYKADDPAGQRAAWSTLHTCMKSILLLQAPITPFITDYFWCRLYGEESIHKQRFPEAVWDRALTSKTNEIIEFNSRVWNMKKSLGKSLKDPIKVEIPSSLTLFSSDLILMHNIIQ